MNLPVTMHEPPVEFDAVIPGCKTATFRDQREFEISAWGTYAPGAFDDSKETASIYFNPETQRMWNLWKAAKGIE